MRSTIKYEMAVGVVFVAAMIILGYYTIIMSQKYHDAGDMFSMSVLFDDVGGLSVKDKVNVNGVESGTVNDIQLHDGRVMVMLEMYNRFAMYENYRIMIRSSAVLGGRYISIDPGVADDRDGFHYAEIEYFDNLTGDLDDPLANISAVISENRENIYLTIRNIRDITEKINTGQGTLGKLVNEDKLHSGADNLVKDLREAVEDTREQAPITSLIRAALTIF